MKTSGNWRPLPLGSSDEVPTLLSSIEIGASNYTVRITDTANLWVESLDLKAIRARGWSEGTSLDPGDSPENMAKLLSCLHAALEPSHKDHWQTSMSLAQASPSDAGDGGLTITLSYPLPGLKPLEWPMHLRKASSSTIATALVLPLVQDQHSRAREIESLTTLLAQKDAVITKLLDKLEATGTGLEQIFNQISGKKKATRSAAAEKVKGLAPFDRQQWQHDLERQKGPRNTDTLLREVFKGDNVQRADSLVTEESPKLDRWWLDLKGTLQIPQRDRGARQPAASHSPMNLDSPAANVEEEDDFQLQETPPHLVSRSKKNEMRNTQVADDASTASEDDELTASQPAPDGGRAAKSVAETTSTKPSVARMGAIGGGKASPSKRAVSPAPATSTAKAGNDSDTASDVADNDGDETASDADASPPPSPPRKLATSKGRMGQIGGQAAKAATRAMDEDAKKEEGPSRRSKLGTIGKGQTSKATEASTTNTKLEDRGRHPTRETNKTKDEPRETSTERADRRREELKKELEKKAAAGPAKKKRKF